MAEEDNNRKKPTLSENTPKSKFPKVKFNFYWLYGILAVTFIGLQIMNWGGTTKEIGWGEYA